MITYINRDTFPFGLPPGCKGKVRKNNDIGYSREVPRGISTLIDVLSKLLSAGKGLRNWS